MSKHAEENVPGGVYLCQVDEHISCGACCGLYNVADTRHRTMQAMLLHRSRVFSRVPREMDPILAFKREIEAKELQQRPFPKFHHCPFVGLIGEHFSRVGCLLHPLGAGNQGVDFRGLSYYGGMACRDYFCPATKKLPARFKALVKLVAENWHAYGLLVTERRLIQTLLEETEKRLGLRLDVTHFDAHPERTEALRALLGLKLTWPFRQRLSGDGLCHYLFEDGEYQREVVAYAATGLESSPYDEILRELDSRLPDGDTLRQAERLVAARVVRVVRSFDLC